MGGFIFLADVFSDQVKAATQGSGYNTRDLLLGVLIVLAVGLALFGAVYFRSRRKADQEDQKRISQMTQKGGSGSTSKSTGPKTRERRRKRRQVREHRPRNPSLENTGGLPPPRPDDQLPKY